MGIFVFAAGGPRKRLGCVCRASYVPPMRDGVARRADRARPQEALRNRPAAPKGRGRKGTETESKTRIGLGRWRVHIIQDGQHKKTRETHEKKENENFPARDRLLSLSPTGGRGSPDPVRFHTVFPGGGRLRLRARRGERRAVRTVHTIFPARACMVSLCFFKTP